MSDGPHRSLPLRRAWKKVCEIADGRAHAIEEIVERIPAALAADVIGEIGEGLLKSLRRILTPEQPSLIDDARAQVAALRANARSVMEVDLVESVGDALRAGKMGVEALLVGAEVVLEERGHAAKRSVVEHYLRKAPQARALHIERRLGDALQRATDSLRGLAVGLANGSVRRALPKASDRSGLDDGPTFA
jgi:hypothetical protein